MKTIRTAFMCGLIACLGVGCAGSSWILRGEPGQGDSFPDLGLAVPKTAAEREYLGLSAENGEFRLCDISADVILVEVFDMYCRYCQEGAPQAAELFALSKSPGKNVKVRMIGIGLGNSEYEVALFKRKHKTPFSVFADADNRYRDALGARVSKPSYYVLRLEGKRSSVIEVQSGMFVERMPAAFLARTLERAGF